MAAGVSEQKAEFLADAAASGVMGLTGRPKTTKTGSTSQASDPPEQTTKTENGSAETAQSTKTKVADGAGNGKGPEGNASNPKVTAEAEVDGVIFNDTNQSSRPPELADPNKPTLISDEIQIKIDKNNRNFPNGNMSTAHAEVGAIQQAFEAGKTQGKNMTMRVTGEDVCDYCRSDLRKAADKSGLNSLSVYEETTGRTLTWTRREDGSMGKVKITEPGDSK